MNNLIKIAGLLFLSSVSLVFAQAPEAHMLVRLSNFDGTTSVEIITPTALANLRKDIALENKLIKDAYQNVAKEWRKSHEGKTVKQKIYAKNMTREVDVKAPIPPFPLKNPKPRVISQIGTFQTAEAAAEKKRALDAAVKPPAAEEDKAKPSSSGKRAGRGGEDVDMEGLFASLMSELAKLKEESASAGKDGRK